MALEFSSGLTFFELPDKILLSVMCAWVQQNFADFLFHSEDARLLLPIWVSSDVSSSSVHMEFQESGHSSRTCFLASSDIIISHVWKIIECLSDPLCYSENTPICGSRHSRCFRLQLAQFSSGLRAVRFYVHGSGLHGLCADLVFSKLRLHRFVLSVVFSWAPKSSIMQKTES